MLDAKLFEITLILFVIFSSGLFYVPINRWELKNAKKRKLILKEKLKKNKNIIKAVKNLSSTSNQLTRVSQT
tara:strand:- start:434 stop:649 length:216 start_codon:yes stop_codon:yes gene_type:complete